MERQYTMLYIDYGGNAEFLEIVAVPEMKKVLEVKFGFVEGADAGVRTLKSAEAGKYDMVVCTTSKINNGG